MIATLGSRLVASMIGRSPVDFLDLRIVPGDLPTPAEREIVGKLSDHIRDYGVVPSSETISEWCGGKVPPASEPPAFYAAQIEERKIRLTLIRVADEANGLLAKKEPGAAHQALDVLFSTAMDLVIARHRGGLVDFRESHDLLISSYAAKTKALAGMGSPVLTVGWPSFDKISHGLEVGELFSIVGRPAAGKTFLLLFLALNLWRQGIPILFVSMEMKVVMILERLAAMKLSIPIRMIRGTTLSQPKGLAVYRKGLADLKSAEKPFYVVDGSLSATVPDITALTRSLGVRVVLVDGAYLLQNANPRLGRYEKVSENCDALKRLASHANVLVAASWQFNREAVKKKKGDAAGLEDIAYSDAISQHSGSVVGLFEEESPETLRSRTVRILKGRTGEVGEFRIKWDFDRMDFTEEVSTLEDLQFL